MKGFVFALDETADVERILSRGIFGVRQPGAVGRFGPQAWDPPTWSAGHLETFADWHSVSPGDLIFFFRDRLIYGPGQVVGLPDSPRAGALTNYPDSEISHRPMPAPQDALYGPNDDPDWFRVRVVVLFVGAPTLFRRGIDMDEVLSAYMSDPWPLHYWAGRSFVELTEPEARLLRTAFLRRFVGQDLELPDQPNAGTLQARAAQVGARPIRSSVFIDADTAAYVDDGLFRREETLHAAVMEQLQANAAPFPLATTHRTDCYHELPGSPTKNPEWVDRMDVVACSVWPHTDVVTRFELIEMKRDRVSIGPVSTFDRFFSQPMRYVDFLTRHYAGGNMHAVDVHVIAGSYSQAFLAAFAGSDALPRQYSLSQRDADPIRRWQRVRLWSYRWTGTLTLTPVTARYI